MDKIITPTKQRIRIFNTSGFDCMDFYIFNKLHLTNIKPCEISDYIDCDYGICTFKICNSATGEQLSSSFINVKPATAYTLCTIADNENISLYAIEDKQKASDSNYALVRVCMLSSKYKSCTLSANKQNVICDIKPLDISNYVAFRAGTYDFNITEYNQAEKDSGSKSILASIPKYHLHTGERVSIYIFDNSEEKESLKTVII